MHQVAEHYADPAEQPGLAVVRDLLGRLHAADIAYCHWKSNEHLAAALEGLTDLDVLAERRRDLDLQRILAESGFKRFAAPPLRGYSGIEDYIALDPASGRLVHLHLHFQLTLGERHLKSYRLPWETVLLATRRFDREHGAYVAHPTYETMLLVVRAALKQRLRDRLVRRSVDADFLRELAWLQKQLDDTALREVAQRLLGPAVHPSLRRLLETPVSPSGLAAFAAAARPILRRHRTFGRRQAVLRAWIRELQWIIDAINRRYLHRPTPLRRISPRGGAVVALLGSDGSGKSTLARTLVAWLGVKLDVVPIYFGSGDGPGAIYRMPMMMAYRFLRPLLGPNPNRQGHAAGASRATMRGRFRAAAQVPWALALGCEKRGKLRRMVRARNRGMIVVCDRFPQSEVPGFNDGPLLSRWHDHPWSVCRALAAWEAAPYAEAALESPDLVIKLAVTPETARSRRPEMSVDELQRRVATVRGLRFPTARVVEISSEAPLADIVLEAKRALWEQL
jgi:hypothetical protein